jgi:hypothetical protein
MGVLDQAESLDRKDRQHARHQIEQKPARNGQYRGPNKRESASGTARRGPDQA